jgi:hypothetical protein
MSRCPFVTLVLMLLTGVAAPARAAVTLWTTVPVRVYDATGAGHASRQPALDLAAAILSAASVDIVWRWCETGCASPVRAGELVVRLVRADDAGRAVGALPLGDALIDRTRRAGVLATVYVDRVEWTARHTGVDATVLLGRALAHELGHLLLATSAHSVDGLMRPVWSRAELQRSRLSDWVFGATEIAAIRAKRRVR